MKPGLPMRVGTLASPVKIAAVDWIEVQRQKMTPCMPLAAPDRGNPVL